MQGRGGRILKTREYFPTIYVDDMGVARLDCASCLCLVRSFSLSFVFLIATQKGHYYLFFVGDGQKGREGSASQAVSHVPNVVTIYFFFLLHLLIFVGQPVVLMLLCKSRPDLEGRL